MGLGKFTPKSKSLYQSNSTTKICSKTQITPKSNKFINTWISQIGENVNPRNQNRGKWTHFCDSTWNPAVRVKPRAVGFDGGRDKKFLRYVQKFDGVAATDDQQRHWWRIEQKIGIINETGNDAKMDLEIKNEIENMRAREWMVGFLWGWIDSGEYNEEKFCIFWLKFVVVGFTMVVVMEEIGVGGGGREKEEEGRGIIVISPLSTFIKGKKAISGTICWVIQVLFQSESNTSLPRQ